MFTKNCYPLEHSPQENGLAEAHKGSISLRPIFFFYTKYLSQFGYKTSIIDHVKQNANVFFENVNIASSIKQIPEKLGLIELKTKEHFLYQSLKSLDTNGPESKAIKTPLTQLVLKIHWK